MSYILEALKKAQAERQLGTLPTIHAPQLQGRDDAAGARFKKPLWLAMGLLTLTLALMMLLWRQPWQGAVPAAPLQAPATAPLAAVPSSAVPLPAVPSFAVPSFAVPSSAVPLPAVLSFAVPSSAVPLPAVPLPVARPSVVPLPAMQPSVVAARPAMTLVVPDAPPLAAPPPLPARAAAPAAPVPPSSALPAANTMAQDPLLSLRELPEPIQRQIAALAIGGYIYSKNPADRLLLVDKVLRHEGEEVGPGLTLEKLQPKSAVFNFNGYRYRVPY